MLGVPLGCAEIDGFLVKDPEGRADMLGGSLGSDDGDALSGTAINILYGSAPVSCDEYQHLCFELLWITLDVLDVSLNEMYT